MAPRNTNLILFLLIIEVILFTGLWATASIDTKVSWGLVQTETPRAWKMTEGRADVVVAVIDTGVDIHHPELQDCLWKNPFEIPANGIDDDSNGYVDDVYGWNFAQNSADVSDVHGHGTHITGLIAANGRSEGGMKGVAPKVKIMTLKYYDANASPQRNLKALIASIHYAIDMKARIINFSGGGASANAQEEAAIKLAEQKNILFVAAAGNEKTNTDFEAYYPADYALDNILSVAALNPRGQLLESSNYGARTVDLAAPGENLLSTLPQGQMGLMSGTSQATALVSGAAALLISLHPDWKDPAKIIRHLVRSGDRDSRLKGKTKYQSRLNSFHALAMSED